MSYKSAASTPLLPLPSFNSFCSFPHKFMSCSSVLTMEFRSLSMLGKNSSTELQLKAL